MLVPKSIGSASWNVLRDLGEFDEFQIMRKPTTVSMQSGGNVVQHAAA